ncbi:iron transporter [Microtetraspora sp. NBRC 13810]|uniref:EfeM/EfeO family lipoprotein n=1 Tax=Microtetraspora sp. NBRC 13810 TaxID=3030990 RepID=UPI0024A3A6A6|nr:EfeM/EfeO family lipoprotein [Microtetraspora sp. NBRC 13810]GLW10830.1 iron transporter [Microtetraspora sp. NBRC 13810]
MGVRRLGAVVLASLLLATGCSEGGTAPPGTPAARGSAAPQAPPSIRVSASHCGEGWTHPHTGDQTLMVANDGDVSAGADLIDVPGGAVHAELEGLAPGTTRTVHVSLGPGTYAIRCEIDGRDPIAGPPVTVSGGGSGGPATLPVTYNDLYAPAQAYRDYVAGGLKTLVARTRTLAGAVDAGDLAAARAAWLPAHLAYESLGAAYDTFGDFDGEIDGRPAGLPGGVRDPGFTGMHRVEYGLWHGESAKSLRPAADRLYKDVRALRADFPDEQLEPGDLPLRAHEILENTLRFELSGRADEGSGTTLATAAANLRGTRATVGVLRPLLRTRYPGLAGLDRRLDRVEALLKAQRHGGRWTPVEDLDPPVRESIDGAVGDLLEGLAPIATICFPRRTQ